jgi:hypothetical protein
MTTSTTLRYVYHYSTLMRVAVQSIRVDPSVAVLVGLSDRYIRLHIQGTLETQASVVQHEVVICTNSYTACLVHRSFLKT